MTASEEVPSVRQLQFGSFSYQMPVFSSVCGIASPEDGGLYNPLIDAIYVPGDHAEDSTMATLALFFEQAHSTLSVSRTRCLMRWLAGLAYQTFRHAIVAEGRSRDPIRVPSLANQSTLRAIDTMIATMFASCLYVEELTSLELVCDLLDTMQQLPSLDDELASIPPSRLREASLTAMEAERRVVSRVGVRTFGESRVIAEKLRAVGDLLGPDGLAAASTYAMNGPAWIPSRMRDPKALLADDPCLEQEVQSFVQTYESEEFSPDKRFVRFLDRVLSCRADFGRCGTRDSLLDVLEEQLPGFRSCVEHRCPMRELGLGSAGAIHDRAIELSEELCRTRAELNQATSSDSRLPTWTGMVDALEEIVARTEVSQEFLALCLPSQVWYGDGTVYSFRVPADHLSVDESIRGQLSSGIGLGCPLSRPCGRIPAECPISLYLDRAYECTQPDDNQGGRIVRWSRIPCEL